MFGKKKNKDSNCIVVGLGPNSILFMSSKKNGAQKLEKEYITKQVADTSEYATVIPEVFTSLGITRKTIVKVVLLKGMYNTIQIDKPKAPDEEMQGAVQWAIKDYVQDSVMNYAIDYIDMPKSPTYPNDKVLVVSSQKTLIKKIIEIITKIAILEEITVEEVALADLYGNEDEQVHMILFQPEGYDLNLITIWHNRLFFTRSLRGFKDLYKYQKGSVDAELLDSLSLELQRSLDYMVAQLKLPNPKLLTLALDCPDRDSISTYLSTTFGFTVNLVSEDLNQNSAVYLPLLAQKGIVN